MAEQVSTGRDTTEDAVGGAVVGAISVTPTQQGRWPVVLLPVKAVMLSGEKGR